MKRVRLASVCCCGRGALLAAFLAAAPLFAAPKDQRKEPPPSSAKPAKPAQTAPTGAKAPKTAPANPVASPKPESSPEKPPTPAPARQPDEDLYEGPSAIAKPKPAAKPAGPDARAADTSPSPGPKYADAWPSEYRKPEGDLLLGSAETDRAQAMAEYVRGLHADKRGDVETALDAWKHAASLDPSNAQLAVRVAFELAKRNEPGEAIRILKDSIAAEPKDPRTHIYLSKIYSKHLNKADLALAALQKAVEVAPDNFEGWGASYDFQIQAGEQKKATELIDRALKSASKDADFWLQLGRKLMLKGKESPSPDELRQMEFAYRKASDLKPNDASTLAQAGDFFVIAKKDAEALSFYERAMKLNQPARDEITKNLPEKYARRLLKANRTEEALTILEKMASNTQESMRSDLYDWLGRLYEATGKIDKAIEHFRQTLVLDTAQPDNHLRLAEVFLRAKRYDEALQIVEVARQKFPKNPDVTSALAQILSMANRHAEALAMFETAANEYRARDDGGISSRFVESWALAAERGGKLEQAVDLLKKGIADHPDNPAFYNNLGYLWVDRGLNLEEAGAMIKKAVEMESDNPAYVDSLGWYYYKSGKFEDARRELLRALSHLEKDDPTILDHLGDACEKVGQLAEAVKYWERSLKAEPEDPVKIQEKLQAARKKIGT